MKKITDSVYSTLNISSGLTSNPQAWIVSSKDRGRKKIYNKNSKSNKVYLADGEKFQIELYNRFKKYVKIYNQDIFIKFCLKDIILISLLG